MYLKYKLETFNFRKLLEAAPHKAEELMIELGAPLALNLIYFDEADDSEESYD